jgi:hypothetical protein
MRDLTENPAVKMASSIDLIIETLEKNPGPYRDIDMAVHFAFLCVPNTGQDTGLGHPVDAAVSPFLLADGLHLTDGTLAEPYTSSVDAVLGLARKVLPRYWPDVVREGISALGRTHHWAGEWPKDGQMDELASAMLLRLVHLHVYRNIQKQ